MAPKISTWSLCEEQDLPKRFSSGKTTKWINCDSCSKWFHPLCVGIKAAEYHKASKGFFKCVICCLSSSALSGIAPDHLTSAVVSCLPELVDLRKQSVDSVCDLVIPAESSAVSISSPLLEDAAVEEPVVATPASPVDSISIIDVSSCIAAPVSTPAGASPVSSPVCAPVIPESSSAEVSLEKVCNPAVVNISEDIIEDIRSLFSDHPYSQPTVHRNPASIAVPVSNPRDKVLIVDGVDKDKFKVSAGHSQRNCCLCSINQSCTSIHIGQRRDRHSSVIFRGSCSLVQSVA